MSSPDVLQSVYEDSSTKSAGSAMEENQKYLDSISGHLAKLTNAWQEMWANAANRDVINGFIDLGTKILELINDAGLLKSAFAVLFGGTIIKGLTNANSLLVKYVQLLTQTKSLSSVLTETFANIFNKKLAGWEAIKQAWSNRGQAPTTATPTQPQTDTYQPNAYDDAINAQLIGQNAALDENTQKKRENAQAQRELTEATNEGTASSAASTEQQTAETVANTENAASSQEQAASELDEAAAKSANLTATEGLNTAEQQEASTSMKAAAANGVQAESELAEATNKMAGSGAEVFDVLTEAMEGAGEAASGMGGAIKEGVGGSVGLLTALGGHLDVLKTKLISFFTSPSALMLAIPLAIGAYNKVISDYNRHQRELIDQAHEASSAWSDTQKSVQDYSTKYSNLKSQLDNANLSEAETVDIKKQIYDLQTQITDQYGESASGLDLINGKLEQQLGIIQNITQEEAKRTYGSNREAYERAIGEMNRERNYTINTQGLSQEEISNLFEGIDYEAELDFVTGDETAKTFKNVDTAEEDLNTLNDRLLTIKESMSEGEWAASKYAKVYDDVSKAISANNDVIAENRADARAGLETQLLMAGDSTGRDLQKNYKAAVDEYNQALITSTDSAKIEEAQNKVADLQEQVDTFLQGDNAKYSPLFKDIDDSINKTLQDTFNLRQKMRSDEGKSIIESAFGDIKKNKADSQEINDELLETAQRVVDLQKQANEWGVIDNLAPITGMKPDQTVFGNIDLNDRQILDWTKKNKEKFADAWKSYNDIGWDWGEMPEIGDISTVLGASGTFGGAEIAFSPILQGEDGKPELLSAQSLTTYLDAVVHQATDKKTGKVNLDKILEIDADPKRGGKKLIAGVGKAGDEAVRRLGNSMHFLGSDGALTTSMRDLAHMAREANIPITQVMQSLQQYGSTSGLANMLKDTVVSAGDVENALMGADDAVSQILRDLAQDFGITMETPDDQIQAFINELATMGLVAADSAQSSQSSLDHFFRDTSAKIEQLSSLTSVLQKGQSQTGLTFTKTLDEQGNQVASEVKSIIDAYKDLEGYDLGSLFEETGTGIKLNMDAYRALAQEEEAETKRQYKLQRAALENQLATAAPDRQDAIKQQIIELDMLSSAYDGATSALAKYLNQQNASDYGDTYSMLQGTTIKRGDELLEKGLIGTEEFRSIAQLFSFKSLATEDAQGVADAYEKGIANVRKYFTEDAVDGVYQFATDIEQLPEKFGNIARDADGAFTFDLTDQQLNNLAEHFEVSTDVIEAFFDQIRATGGEVHLWRDGGFEDFKELDENIDASKEKLKELKEVSNDPNLISKLDFDASDVDTIDEVKQKIEDFKDIKAKLPVDSEEAKEAQKVIDGLEAKLKEYEEAAANARNTSPVTVESYQEANDIVNQINDGLLQMQSLEDQNIAVSVTGANGTTPSQTLQDLSVQISQLPDEVQEYVMVEAGLEWRPGMTPEDIQGQMQGKFETTKITASVDADTTSAEQKVDNLGNEAKATTAQIDADTSQADSKVDALISKVTSPITAIVGMEVEASEVETARANAEKPIETPVTFKATNNMQQVANEAGAQGVTANRTENVVKNEQTNVTVNANTGQLTTAQGDIDRFKANDGASVNMSVGVSGVDSVTQASDKVDDLAAKNGKKVNITIGGNTAAFNKTITNATTQLTTLSKKNTTPAIKADNSKLMSAANAAKSKLDSIKSKSITISAHSNGFGSILSEYRQLKSKSITLTTNKVTNITTNRNADGTAHSAGTLMSGGKAFAGGDWGLPKAEKGALINELGSEIVVMPSGQWLILNNGDPTFANLPKGAIIFNHKQSEDLLKNGYVTGSHGKLVGGAFARGTVDEDEDINEEDLDELTGDAFAAGTAKWNGQLSGEAHAGKGTWNPSKAKRSSSSNSNKSSGKSSGKSSKSKKSGKSSGKSNKSSKSSSSSKAKDFLETLDSIEIQINRIDALFQKLDTDIGKTYASFASRASNATSEISKLGDEIKRIDASLNSKSSKTNYLYKAAEAAKAAGLKSGDEGYTKTGAKGTALSQGWITWIQNSVNTGKYMTIDDVKDEGLWKKIQAYQTWYEKYVKLQQKRQDYVNKMSQLTIQQLQLIQTEWEAVLNNLNAYITENQNRVDLQTEQGYDASVRYYNNQINYNKTRLTDLNKETAALQAKLNEAVSAGYITKYSEEWYKWQTQIKNVQNEVINTTKEIARLNNEIRQLKWDRFDRAQDKLSDLAEEMKFLNGLIYENDKFTEEGNITNRGRAAMGLIAMQYDEYIKQAKRYQKEVAALNKDLANDPYNNKLIEQRNTWLKAQQDAIENARQQKEAMTDLIEDGIKKQIDYMDELIDKYEDALDAEKAQNKYAEEMAEKQKKVNSIQKQLRALEGDDSEEGQTRRQKLRDDLKEAQKDLKDAQEDQRLSDISDALSEMQEKYEDVLNARLDNIDKLFAESVTAVNQNGASIVSEIQAIGKSVDYNFSELLNGIVTDKSTQDKASDTSSKALVSGTNDTTGLLTNTSAAAVKDRDTGWKKSGNDWYYADEYGNAQTGWVKDKNKWYYLDDNGKMIKGWQQVNGKWYHMDNSGAMQSGWQKIKNKWYYLNDENDGSMATGWKKVKDKWYYMDSNGAMQTGWQQVNNKWYYLDGSGAMKTGWQKSNNKWYYLDKKTGAMTTGWQKDQNKWYYMDQTGKMTTGWQQVNNKWYYMDGSGVMQTGWKKSNNKWYYLKDDGSMATGWQRVSNKWYYMDNSGAMTTGWQKVNNKWYYMNGSGQMLTGEQKIGQNTYYLGQDGAMRTGKFVVNGITYITDSSGKIKSKVRGKYAKGTASVKQTGLYQVDEQGEEVFINKQGKIYTRLEKGSTVLPHDAAVNLLKGMTNPAEFIANHMDMRPNKNITTTNNTSGNVTNYITFNMDGVTNYQEFMREAQRDPNFTKYIQEISIGKLNGNNSLKGNSIRFR